jgi:hypothetical protein
VHRYSSSGEENGGRTVMEEVSLLDLNEPMEPVEVHDIIDEDNTITYRDIGQDPTSHGNYVCFLCINIYYRVYSINFCNRDRIWRFSKVRKCIWLLVEVVVGTILDFCVELGLFVSSSFDHDLFNE